MKGLLITHEGVEGSGKSTQHKMNVVDLLDAGVDVLFPPPREPGGTEVGERIRDVLLSSSSGSIGDVTELLLFEAARSQLIEDVIAPALNSGKTVVLDRFFDSTTAYQGFGRGIDLTKVSWLNAFASRGIVPNLTFVYDIDVEEGLLRATRETADRLEAEDLAFHNLVRRGYLTLARMSPERVIVIDASRSIEEINRDVRRITLELIERSYNNVR